MVSGSIRNSKISAFTLIELSIVLVIIGLIVGGVLVGRDLISAAAVRAQISQIEKYQQAVNTFKGKYGYLPGDIPDPDATRFGFIARGNTQGTGDGNGVIEGNGNANFVTVGETAVFWVDLSAAKLIGHLFNTSSETTYIGSGTVTASSTPSLKDYFPTANLGNGGYIYVWSGYYGPSSGTATNLNYFGLSAVTTAWTGWTPNSTPNITVNQAYTIDKKMDDGLPQSGNIMALYINHAINTDKGTWAAGGGVEGANNAHYPTTSAITGTSTTCYDNAGNTGTAQQYSITQSNGTGVNCALSFKFQ